MSKINTKPNRIMNIISATNVIAAIIIGTIIKKLLIDNPVVNQVSSKYFVISGVVSLLIAIISLIGKTKKINKKNKEILTSENGKKISMITELDENEVQSTLTMTTRIIVIFIVVIIQMIAGFIAYNKGKDFQNSIVQERTMKVNQISDELNKDEDIFEVGFLDEKTYNSIYIVKKLSNYNETIRIRFGFDENNKIISYPASIDGYYATKDLDLTWVIGSVITFMQDMTKIEDIDENLYKALIFNPTNTQIDLLKENLEEGIDNSENVVYSTEPINYDGKEWQVRFRYKISTEEDSLFEGSDELAIQYILGSGM